MPVAGAATFGLYAGAAPPSTDGWLRVGLPRGSSIRTDLPHLGGVGGSTFLGGSHRKRPGGFCGDPHAPSTELRGRRVPLPGLLRQLSLVSRDGQPELEPCARDHRPVGMGGHALELLRSCIDEYLAGEMPGPRFVRSIDELVATNELEGLPAELTVPFDELHTSLALCVWDAETQSQEAAYIDEAEMKRRVTVFRGRLS